MSSDEPAMLGERRRKILRRLIGDGLPPLVPKRLCEVGAQVTGMSGAGIMLMSGNERQGSIGASDAVSALIEDLQFELGEGPCVDAYHLDRPVAEPDLVSPSTPRWLAFTGPAVEAGVGAVFGFPLRAGVIRLGALNLYRSEPGALTDDQEADALVLAVIVAQAVLSMQAKAPAGQLAVELEAAGDHQNVVHQATGMIAAQLDVGVAEALARLRAHAFAAGLPLIAVARDVVDRRLRLSE